ncbi:MAG: CAP domain-containing protein [Gemmatimonadota bacterium]
MPEGTGTRRYRRRAAVVGRARAFSVALALWSFGACVAPPPRGAADAPAAGRPPRAARVEVTLGARRAQGTAGAAERPAGTSGLGARSPSAGARAPGSARWHAFGDELLELANRDRRAAGLRELAVDPEARAFAAAEADRLVREAAFSHHAADGSKPYLRWARRGGTAHVRENLYRLRATGERAYMLFSAERAHDRLMGSAGHRRAILEASLTGAGMAVAYDRTRNSVVVVQELVARHVALLPVSGEWRAGDARDLEGHVLTRGAEPWMAVLYREAEVGSAAARREAAARAYREGSGMPVRVFSRGDFATDPLTGRFRLAVRLPPHAGAGTYTLVVYLWDPREPRRERWASTAEGFAAATVVFDVVDAIDVAHVRGAR